MSYFSSKKSLLSGVSAVVLATTVGVSAVGVSGALAQTVDYTHSSGVDVWADGGTERAADDTTSADMAEARAGDNLTLEGGVSGFTSATRPSRRSIGILRGGTNGAGEFVVLQDIRTNEYGIGKIIKQVGNSARAVDLTVGSGSSANLRSVTLTVGGDAGESATVRNLTVRNVSTFNNSSSRTIFKGNLTVEGATQISANGTRSIDATLTLKGALNKFAGDITLNDQARGDAYLTISGSGDQRIVGRLDVSSGTSNADNTGQIRAASDGEGAIKVLNGRDGLSAREVTFDIQIGHDDATDANDRRLKQLEVGERSKGGHAILNREVHVDNIDVIAGNTVNESSVNNRVLV